MLWAIDVGNTHTVVGLFDGRWRVVWRLTTHSGDTEDQLAASLLALCNQSGIPFSAEGIILGSVVPSINQTWRKFGQKYLQVDPVVMSNCSQVGLSVTYDPPHAVGADRIANALAALATIGAPVIVVDFGTATTFDTVDEKGNYLGGAIMPGVQISMRALADRAAKLPQIELEAPQKFIGTSTVEALRSGVMFGYAGAVDAIVTGICQELSGDVKVIGTGGLASAFLNLCKTMHEVKPDLTLDGLIIAYHKIVG